MWQPGMPLLTADDRAAWVAWRRARKLQQQRDRRASLRRIDYYPSPEAAALIDEHCSSVTSGDYSTVIDALILGELPE